MIGHSREIIAFLFSIGATDVRLEHGGKHPRVVYIWEGKERYKAIAGTPSSPKSAMLAIADIRRTLGLRPPKVARHADPAVKPRQRRPRASDPPSLTPLPDFRDRLKLLKTSIARRQHSARVAARTTANAPWDAPCEN